jgi:anhydro-N-acetylmuramic acid kinase
MMRKKYKVIGLMSGTSLDGLDIAYCEFEKNKKWKYKIIYSETKKYNKKWKQKLSEAFKAKKKELEKLDKEYGNFIGKEVLKFIIQKKISPDFIASHGHTVFHQPEKKFTLQIGDGAAIYSVCHLPVVYDFRSGDVALGGQGAPLVPIADKLLFSEYDFCLNLGGIANISYDNQKEERIAYDICPVNIVLNFLANQLGKEFDRDGKIATRGNLHRALLEKLNKLSFYEIKPPKSLGREWVEKNFFPVLGSFDISIQDKLRTVVEHIAIQISLAVNSSSSSRGHSSLLVTGGGAYNKFLMERISAMTKCRIILPDDKTIQFKEAMAFAFLGVLKMRDEINILKSVTGAKEDSSGGKIFP